MITLYFLRHAIAEEPGTGTFTEETRPLTSEGIEKMEKAAQGMKNLGLEFQALWSSPLTRALQTAEIVKKAFDFKKDIEIEIGLSPGSSLQNLLKKISLRKEKSFLMTGHEPSLSLWIQSLLGMRPSNAVIMKKAALCHLQLHGDLLHPETELISLFQPKILRLAAG